MSYTPPLKSGVKAMLNVGMILYPGFQVLGLSMSATFEVANQFAGKDVYGITLLSEHGGMVKTSAGFCVETEAFDDRRFDTLMVLGDNVVRPASAGLVDYLVESSSMTRRVCSICTGSAALAQAGLLDNRRVTTHWEHAPDLQATYPSLRVDSDRIFINDGPIWTAAGMSACLDLPSHWSRTISVMSWLGRYQDISWSITGGQGGSLSSRS